MSRNVEKSKCQNVEFWQFPKVCREKSSNDEKCRVLKIPDGLSDGGVWGWVKVFGSGWRCLEVFGVLWAGRSRFGLVPIGDFVITRRYATRREMSRKVEKCWVLSKSLLGGGPFIGNSIFHFESGVANEILQNWRSAEQFLGLASSPYETSTVSQSVTIRFFWFFASS